MKRKILLMGKSGSGKTSMRSFIFSSYRPEDTKRLGSTIEVEHSHVRFPGSLVLNLWDCGGQKSYMESYMDTQRTQVFSAVGVLIYVVDLVNTDDEGGDTHEWEADLRYFRDCLSALQSNSPGAEVFCLLHKMDLIEPSRRRDIYRSRVADLRRKTREVLAAHASSPNASDHVRLHCFATSIWDATLYRAWSSIIHTLVPDVERLEAHLALLSHTCSASEVVLFEKATFLVMSYYSQMNAETTTPRSLLASDRVTLDAGQDTDDVLLEGLSTSMLPDTARHTPDALSGDRFERISELVKHFKISCLESHHQIQALELRTPTFAAYLDVLTSSTYILVITTDPAIQISAVKRNVELSRAHFEQLQASHAG
ncbi:GTP-binding protein gtr1 [Malassezia japonica]|uniref:GTP-binding protein n=1 Tax=Malassezia japonica TaxID=223818 RepID=A0AAF0J9E3_9BASI|nr:GTP-binding protein gtr1 [Malassezia japonica]WFD38263.1 GTP-binding protein gtr1 [Malassezia japonica]